MKSTLIKVGQVWAFRPDWYISGPRFKISRVDIDTGNAWAFDSRHNKEGIFLRVDASGQAFLAYGWQLVTPEKIIPSTTLDPTLHILEAGYLQDRMRRRGK